MANVNEIPVKAYLKLECEPVNTDHAASKGYVDGQITALDAAKAAAEHTHVAASVTDLGTAAKKGFTTSVTSGSADLVTSGGVYSYIAGLNLGTTYAAKTHTHSLGSIIYSGSTGYAAGTTIGSTSTDGQLATAKAVYDYIVGLNLGTTYAASSHNHAAGDITSGTLGSARLPNATTSAKGGVIVGAGLSVSSGTVSVDYATCKTGLGLGSAAYLSTGTASGNIPVLDGAGKLPASVMPARVIGGEYLGEVSNQAGMIAKSTATVGDFVKRTDTGTYWMLGVDGDDSYATAANWHEYAGAVASVNGAVGTVTQSQLGLVTAFGTSNANVTDTKFPSFKLVNDSYAAKSHTHTSANVSDSISAGSGITSSETKLVQAKAVQAYVSGAGYAISAFTSGSGGQGKVVKTLSSGTNAGYISADLIPIDEQSLVTDAAGTLQVSNSWLSDQLTSFGYLTANTAKSTYLNQSATGLSQWGNGATYNAGDVVLYNGKIYSSDSGNNTGAFPDTTGVTKAWTEISIFDLVNQSSRYDGTITGNGSATEFTVTHGLGVKDVDVVLIDNSTDQEVYAAVTLYSTTQVKIGFGAAPASGKVYRVVVRK